VLRGTGCSQLREWEQRVAAGGQNHCPICPITLMSLSFLSKAIVSLEADSLLSEQIRAMVDRRLQLAAPIREVAEHPVPRNTASWFYVFGSAALQYSSSNS